MNKLHYVLPFLLIGAVSRAGVISHNDYTAGSVITAAGQNANENTIVNEFNGNIDNTNIKTTAGINLSKLSLTDAVTFSSITVTQLNVSTISVVGNQVYGLIYSSMVCVNVASATTASSYVPTNTAITLTPHRTTSRIEIIVNGILRIANATNSIAWATLFKGSTNFATTTTGSGTDLCTTLGSTGTEQASNCSIVMIDTTTALSPTTYTVEIKNGNNSTAVTWNGASVGAYASCIIAKEWAY